MMDRLWYTLAMVAAVSAAAYTLGVRRQNAALPSLEKFGLCFAGLVGATFAAKLPFLYGGIVDHGWVGAWMADGKTILWGLVGGYLGVELAKWALLIRVRTGDWFVVPVAVSVAIGRLGCFGYGCCYGTPTDQTWGFLFAAAPEGGALLRHPAQLYEFSFHVAFAAIAGWAIARDIFSTGWMLIYLISYSLFRFISEWWREEPSFAWGLTFYQISALAILFGFSLILLTRIRSGEIRFRDRATRRFLDQRL